MATAGMLPLTVVLVLVVVVRAAGPVNGWFTAITEKPNGTTATATLGSNDWPGIAGSS